MTDTSKLRQRVNALREAKANDQFYIDLLEKWADEILSGPPENGKLKEVAANYKGMLDIIRKSDFLATGYLMMLDALEFYANRENWGGFEEEDGFLWQNEFIPADLFKQDYSNEVGTIMTAGRRAREVLAKLEKEG